MKSFIYIATLLLLIITSACNESYQEIDWELEGSAQRLTVDGEITSELKQQQIQLTKSDEYFANKPAGGINDASVLVSDGSTSYSFSYLAESIGMYVSDNPFAGEVGKQYELSIDLAAPLNNETHYSATSEMKRGITLDSISTILYPNVLSFTEDADSLMLLLTMYGQEPAGSGDYYQFLIAINDTVINDTASERTVIYDLENGIDSLYAIPSIVFEDVNFGDKVTFEVQSVSKAYRDFIRGIQQIANGTDPLGLSGPPANAVGNITGGEAMGFFQAKYVSRKEGLASPPKYP